MFSMAAGGLPSVTGVAAGENMDAPPKAVRAALAERMKAARTAPARTAERRPRRRCVVVAAVICTVAGALVGRRGARSRADRDRRPEAAEHQPADAVATQVAAPENAAYVLRAVAEQALTQRLPGTDLSSFKPGYIVYMENSAEPAEPFVFVDWIGQDALAVEKGATPALDRKLVRKLRVKLTADGRVLDVQDTRAWLYRSKAAASPSSE